MVGAVMIGGQAPVVIQSMTNTQTTDVAATLAQIEELTAAGCELVRVAVPDKEAARALPKIAKASPIPLVADIHFDHKLALEAITAGVSKVRINPGNIGGTQKLAQLVREAEKEAVALRIGVNAGSLERDILGKHGGVTAAALVDSALRHLAVLEAEGFRNVVVSLKASDVLTTIKAYRLFSAQKPYPLHLGVTGAGPYEAGLIKGAIGIGTLLADGIGDTVRVSLTASPVDEVRVARSILQALGLRKFGPELISCPTCGRCSVDLIAMVSKVEKMLEHYNLPLKVAVMGCVVNGPGEAKEADLGISVGKESGIVFRHGEVIRTVKLDQLFNALKQELNFLATDQEQVNRNGR